MEKVKDAIIKKGITAVAVLHDLNLAAMFCDEIVMMKNGEIYCKGSPKETFTAANLKEIYELECSIFYTENDIPYIIPDQKEGINDKKIMVAALMLYRAKKCLL